MSKVVLGYNGKLNFKIGCQWCFAIKIRPLLRLDLGGVCVPAKDHPRGQSAQHEYLKSPPRSQEGA